MDYLVLQSILELIIIIFSILKKFQEIKQVNFFMIQIQQFFDHFLITNETVLVIFYLLFQL